MSYAKSFDNTKINYSYVKKGPSCLVFLHGIGGNLKAWNTERRYLEKAGFSTLAIDLRGHGMSQRPRSLDSYDLNLFAEDLNAVFDKIKIKDPIIAGHCFGGVVAIKFAEQFPNVTKALILINSTYKAPELTHIVFKKSHKVFINILNKILSCLPFYEKRQIDYKNYIGTGDWNMLRIGEDIIHTSLKSWFFTMEKFADFDGQKALRDIKLPVLIIEGEKDTIFSISVARKLKSLIRNSHLEIIKDQNHIIVLNDPSTIESEIEEFATAIK